jgi:hypothetical protein
MFAWGIKHSYTLVHFSYNSLYKLHSWYKTLVHK